MTNAEIVKQLREASRQKRMEYVVHSVRAKLMRKTLKETLLRGKPLSEAYEGGLGPSMDMGPSGVPSARGRPAQGRGKVGQMGFGYTDPKIIAGSMMPGPSGIGSDEVVQLIGRPGEPASGPGSYAQLLSDLKAAQQAAAAAKDSAMTADEMIQAFQDAYTKFSPDDQKRVRGAARKYLLGMKKGFGGGIK